MIGIELETVKGWVREILADLCEEVIKEDYQIEIIARHIYAHLDQDLSNRVRAEAYTLKGIMARR